MNNQNKTQAGKNNLFSLSQSEYRPIPGSNKTFRWDQMSAARKAGSNISISVGFGVPGIPGVSVSKPIYFPKSILRRQRIVRW